MNCLQPFLPASSKPSYRRALHLARQRQRQSTELGLISAARHQGVVVRSTLWPCDELHLHAKPELCGR